MRFRGVYYGVIIYVLQTMIQIIENNKNKYLTDNMACFYKIFIHIVSTNIYFLLFYNYLNHSLRYIKAPLYTPLNLIEQQLSQLI
jgi:hypothetical protein